MPRAGRISSTTAISMKEQFLLTFYKTEKTKAADCLPRPACKCVSQFGRLSVRQFVGLAFVCHIYSIKAKSTSKWRVKKRERCGTKS